MKSLDVVKHESHNEFETYAIAAKKLQPATIRSTHCFRPTTCIMGNFNFFLHYLIIYGGWVLRNITDAPIENHHWFKAVYKFLYE